MPIAYSYIRFSSKVQSKGNSLERQTQLAIDFIQNNPKLKLQLDTKLNMQDLGVSAFKGDNVINGNLGQFIKAINDGNIEDGSYLLVENLDRLSRDQISIAQERFLNIINNGVKIVTLCDNKIFSSNSPSQTIDLIVSLTIMSQAHEEQKLKGQRIHRANESKKLQIINKETKKKFSKWNPVWLTLSKDKTTFSVIEERAEIIRQMFQWSIDGFGIRKIIQKLETQGIAPFVNNEINNSKKPKRWHNGIINRWFNDERVLGHYTLKTKSMQSLIKDYYPEIVTQDMYYRAASARAKRSVRGGGRKGKKHSNIFSKLAVCGYSTDTKFGDFKCAGTNESMIFVNKGGHLNYLQCSRVITGNIGCHECSKSWRYEDFEHSFLYHVKGIDVSVLIGKPTIMNQNIKNNKNLLSSLKGKKLEYEKKISDLISKISDKPELLDLFENKLIELKKEISEINLEIKSLSSQIKVDVHNYKSSSSKKEMLSQYIKLINETSGEEELYELRLKLSELLKSLIIRIEIYAKGYVNNLKALTKLKEFFSTKELAEYVKETNKNSRPFFVVYFKSGETLYLIPDKDNINKTEMSMKYNKDGIIELEHPTFKLH